MQKEHSHYKRTIPALLATLVLACLGLAPAAQAAGHRSIVGLWNVHYFQGSTQLFETYDQWHSDGLEFEVNSAAPGAVCQGTFKQMGNGTVQLYHVVYTYRCERGVQRAHFGNANQYRQRRRQDLRGHLRPKVL